MDAANKQGNAAVDDILEELKSGSKPLPKADDGALDDILAELGMGTKPAVPAVPSAAAGKPAASPAAAVAQQRTAAPAMAPSFFEETAEPAGEAARQPAAEKPAPTRVPEMAVEAAARAKEAGKEPAAQPTGVFAPVGQADAAPAPQAEQQQAKENSVQEAAPGKADKKKALGKTTILDIELSHEAVGPRMGKAAAIDKVDPDKFAGDTELLSWFSGGEDTALSRKEQKKAEKERRRQEAQDKKAKKRRADDDEGEYREIAQAEELVPPSDEGAPLWSSVPGDDVVSGSAFDEDATGAEWPDSGSLFDTGAFPVLESAPAQPAVPAGVAGGNREEETTARAAAAGSADASGEEMPQKAAGGGLGADAAKMPGSAAPADAATATFAAVKEAPGTAAAATAVFSAVGSGEKPARGTVRNTQSYEIGGEDAEGTKVPTAAFTQEFETAGEDGAGTTEAKTLFLDDMVDDRFREFFSETVIVEREELENPRAKRKKKRSRTALITGEFAKLAEQAEAAAEDEFEDYNRPEDAGAVEKDLAALKTNLTRRVVVTGVVSALLLWMGFAWAGVMPIPAPVDPVANMTLFALVYIALLVVAIVVNFTTIATGLIGLVGEPTVDTPPALAGVMALLQAVVLLVQALVAGQLPAAVPETATAEPEAALVVTLFGGVAVLLLCLNAFGKRVRARAILDNFGLVSAGFDHSAAYLLDGTHELAYNITKGLEESDPTLLVSRPTALVKGFLRQSFSQHWSDKVARILGWVLLGTALLAGGVTFVHGQDLMATLSVLAAVFCIGAPLSSSLVSAIPASLLQHSASKIGAVVPGWSAIEDLGTVNVVMAGARDIFPPASVQLRGIKTFQKERIDLAILYAASVLIEGCDTMRDIFLGVIQGKSDMLYEVESLVVETGRGFTAWVENSRVVIGNREMLQKYDIDPPPIEVEMKYVKEGNLPVYLAVSGKLFAMFVVGYRADPEVQETLEGLVKSGVSLLVKSEDMNVTNELIETVYQLQPGAVKVLARRELDMLGPLTEYMPESPGVMTHIGTFTSFIGGMRAAAGCAAAERMSGTVQIASVALAALLSLLLVFSGGLAGLSIPIVLLFQLGWTVLISALPFVRRY